MSDGFVVCPDKGPKRIIRRQPAEFFPADDIVAWWDKANNVVHVNVELFDALDNYQRAAIMRTRSDYTYAAGRPVFG